MHRKFSNIPHSCMSQEEGITPTTNCIYYNKVCQFLKLKVENCETRAFGERNLTITSQTKIIYIVVEVCMHVNMGRQLNLIFP